MRKIYFWVAYAYSRFLSDGHFIVNTVIALEISLS